ncbi:2-polyprenyl-6-methoxyphenol hydroxylase-like FAD-dependent oxidoreductase [Saccharothrix coeruleofusca]|uniref:FAD-dependent oxidoreductase n=1 Tax=Saccharothrix coeruleofusca TaxID=33919 RepID=UPI001AE3F201|nr:FAD-dependent monooxygenase [Saccharothrix coeruleofusca]MBP2338196.1 2-polyprenyl-6-methoxyphenol hydroxylase-like FAD-dependent oxidoreductase [Saccharothrix coeruleofusca]
MGKVGDHAVVLGASIAGLLSARVLADAYRHVTVVERDPLPVGVLDRKGVPQGRHSHALLPRGVAILDELFPGLLAKFAADGVPAVESPAQMWFDVNGQVLGYEGPPEDYPPQDHPGYQPSRPYLESRVRDEVRAMPGVVFRDGCAAIDLVASGDRVAGVRVAAQDGREEVLPADLVVDATGRGGRTPVWLKRLGYDAPDEEQVPVDVTYTSRHLRLPPGALGDLLMVIVSAVPQRPTAMGLLAQEEGRYVLTLGGYAGQRSPTDLEGFLAFAERMAPPHVFAALRQAEWLDDARTHRVPMSRRRYYERLRRFPGGLLVVGDGVCSFNPLFGQGMTMAAIQATTLRDSLADGGPDLARRFFTATAKWVDQAWRTGVGADRQILGLPQSRVERVIGAYIQRLQAVSRHDPVLAGQFQRVNGLIDPAATLFKPATVLRVLTGGPRRRS